MKAAVFAAPNRIRWEERPYPDPKPGEVVVRLEVAGLCSTDIHKIAHAGVPAGTVLGHEVAGVIDRVGAGVRDFAVGDRVYCGHHVPCFTCRSCIRGHLTLCRQFRTTNFDPGGYAEFFRLSPLHVAHNLYRIPAGVAAFHGAMVEPVATVLRGLQRLNVHSGDVAVVMGAGPIGAIWVQVLKHAGCARVICSDLSPFRLEQVQRLGADAGVRVGEGRLAATVEEFSQGRGADLIVIAAGVPGLLTEAIDLAAAGARILVFAAMEAGVTIDPARFFDSELHVFGTYSSVPTDFEAAMELIQRRVVDVEPMITHRLPLSRLSDAVALARDRSAEVMKVLLHP